MSSSKSSLFAADVDQPNNDATLRSALEDSIKDHADAMRTTNNLEIGRLQASEGKNHVMEMDQMGTLPQQGSDPQRNLPPTTSSEPSMGLLAGSFRNNRSFSKRLTRTRSNRYSETSSISLEEEPCVPTRSFSRSFRSLTSKRSSNDTSQFAIPLPKMPYESRKARFFQLGVLLLCFAISLIITLTCGRGALGLWATSLMYISDAQKKDETTTSYIETYNSLSHNSVTQPLSIHIPDNLEQNIADVTEAFGTEHNQDNPIFWFIPKSGAKVLGVVLFRCLQLVVASNHGVGFAEEKLEIFEDEVDSIRYVNVDTTTIDGITRAKQLDFASSGIADVTATTLISDIANLFDRKNRGRFFTLMRNPIDRTAALFEDEKQKNEEINIADFIDSSQYQDNFMTRSLINKPVGILTDADLFLAQTILQKKIVVGLYERIEESLEKFVNYFDWNNMNKDKIQECLRIKVDFPQRSHDVLEGHPGWFAVIEKNRYDLLLYSFAEELFNLQNY